MASDPQRMRVVLYGGYLVGNSIAGDTWEWDGSTWAQVTSAFQSPRVSPAMTYDSQRQRVVLVGGMNTSNPQQWETLFHDTWEWDGVTWALRTAGTASSPRARLHGGLAYDTARGVLVLFGGGYDIAPYSLGDTYELSDTSTSWTSMVTPTIRPESEPSMVYDVSRAVTIRFAGQLGAEEWNGTTWTHRTSPTSPSTGSTSCAACPTSPNGLGGVLSYDPKRALVVYFGPAGTWEWDGTAWAQRAPAVSPPARAHSAVAYDASLSRVVVFGGRSLSSNEYLADTWIFEP